MEESIGIPFLDFYYYFFLRGRGGEGGEVRGGRCYKLKFVTFAKCNTRNFSDKSYLLDSPEVRSLYFLICLLFSGGP